MALFAAESNIYPTYYNLISSVKSLPLEQRIEKLIHFLHDYPQFDDVYITLLVWQTYHGKLETAKQQFTALAKSPLYKQNALWMLAKIDRLEGKDSDALSKYLLAFQAGQSSWLFFKEFIEIDCRTGQFSGKQLIQATKMSAEMRSIIAAFYHYFQVNDQATIKIFEELAAETAHNLTILDMWGYAYYYSSQPSKADSIWQLGYQIASEAGNIKAISLFLINQSLIVSEVEKNFDKALMYYDRVDILASQIDDYEHLQAVAGFRGFFYRDAGNLIKAVRYFSTAINIAKQLKAHRFLWDWYRGLSVTETFLGRYTNALAIMDSSVLLANRLNNADLMTRTLIDKAEIYSQLKQLSLAKATLEEAIQLAKTNQLKTLQAMAKEELGQAAIFEGNYSKAMQLYHEYIEMAGNDPANQKNIYKGFGQVAQIHFLKKEFKKAKQVYQKAIQAAKRAKANAYLGQYLFYIGDIERQLGNTDSAIANYNAAMEIAVKDSISGLRWKIHQGYGNIYRKEEKLSKAISNYHQAAKIIEKTRNTLTVDQLRTGYFIEGHTIYENLVQTYLHSYKKDPHPLYLDSLFYYHEMGRSRALQDLRSTPKQVRNTPEYQQTLDKLRRLQKEIRLTSALTDSMANDSLKHRLQLVRLSLLAQQLRPVTNQDSMNLRTKTAIPELASVLKKIKEIRSRHAVISSF